MRQPSYKQFTHLMPDHIKRNRAYSFIWLATCSPPDMPLKVWRINRRTLERARKAGELICCGPTSVKGEWLLWWVMATDEQRREIAKKKIAGRYRPDKRSHHGVNKDKAEAAHANA